jgi:hypothetical protein
MSEKAKEYYYYNGGGGGDARDEAKDSEAKIDSLQELQYSKLKKKKVVEKWDAIDQVTLDESEKKLVELEEEEEEDHHKSKYISIANVAIEASSSRNTSGCDPSSNSLGVSSNIDYSSAPLYSQTLKKYLGLETSSSQYVVYALSIAGLFRTVRGFYRAHHLLQAARFPAGSETRIIHMFKADAGEHEIERAGAYAAWFASTKEVKFRLHGIYQSFFQV